MSLSTRKAKLRQSTKIIEAILNNRFYDNIIRCVKLKDGKYEVIDGQHRLKALWRLYDEYGIRNYTIIMQLFESEESREVFRRLNSGKRLTPSDHLKTLDGQGFTFFDELRGIATHYRTKTNIQYISLLNCEHYYKTKDTKTVHITEMKNSVSEIDSDAISFMYRLGKAVMKLHEKTLSPKLQSHSIQKVAYRLARENNLNEKEIIRLLDLSISNDKVIETALVRFTSNHHKLYELMKRLV